MAPRTKEVNITSNNMNQNEDMETINPSTMMLEQPVDTTTDALPSTTPTTTGMASETPSTSSSQNGIAWEVPLVELKLEHVTYAPLTTTTSVAGPSSPSSANKTSFWKRFLFHRDSGAKKTRTTILHDITTTIAPYKLTAWMGPSGSGKTSLLSVAADLCSPNDIILPDSSSKILVNGERGRIPKRLVGVVWQDDLLLTNLTVEENIYFCARLKTPESTPDEDVQNLVNATMKELGLWNIRNSLVGSPLSSHIRGVSGGERKRVSVASELVLRPSLLLLDEPTSGLDATTAQALIASLKDLANMGHSVAVVIHQPRTTIYNMFDHVLLLSKGHMLYDGQASKARAFLESCPTVTELPPETGIADWMMDSIIEDERRADGGVLVQHWDDCQGGCK